MFFFSGHHHQVLLSEEKDMQKWVSWFGFLKNHMGCLQIENVHLQNDEIMNELSKETENGRLVRILVKLGMMNERPDDDMDPGWSETGDRYLLKLFRDFVFHQVLSLSLFGISKQSWLLFGGWGA
jgi:hypothetical protein